MRVAIRLSVAVAIIAPLLMWLGGGWLTTFGIALLGFGLGRLAERLIFGAGPGEAQGVPWLLLLFPAFGLVLLAGVQFFEYRLSQRQEQEREAAMSARSSVEHVWQVEILPDGRLLSDGQPVETLKPPDHTVRATLTAHEGTPHGRVVEVMEQIHATGIESVNLSSP